MGSESVQPPAAGLPCSAWGRRGLLAPTAPVWGGGGEGKSWCKDSSGVHWGPAFHMCAVASAKHRSDLKTTFIQSHSPLISCFVLEGVSKRESFCALKFEAVKIIQYLESLL